MKQNLSKRVLWLLIPLLSLFINPSWGATKSFTPTNFNGQGSSDGGSISFTNDPITVSSSKGHGYSTGQTRIITGGTLVVSCTSDYNITAISLSFTGSNYQGGLSTSYTGLSTKEWTSSATTGTARINGITVTYETAASCSTPPTVGASSNSSFLQTTKIHPDLFDLFDLFKNLHDQVDQVTNFLKFLHREK